MTQTQRYRLVRMILLAAEEFQDRPPTVEDLVRISPHYGVPEGKVRMVLRQSMAAALGIED